MIPADAIEEMGACLWTARDRAGETPVLVSYSLPWPDDAPRQIFAFNSQREHALSYWSDPEKKSAMVGIGSVRAFRGGGPWVEHQQRWERLCSTAVIHGPLRPLLFGGFCFDPVKHGGPWWRDFPATALDLPSFVLVRDRHHRHLMANVMVDRHSDCAALLASVVTRWQRLCRAPSPLRSAVDAVGRGTPSAAQDDRSRWEGTIEAAVHAIEAGAFKKVVLARATRVPYIPDLAKLLLGLEDRFANTHIFAFCRGGSCFLGASPEPLAERAGDVLRTCALAGSRPRAAEGVADKRLGAELLASPKDRHEHLLVVETLRQTLHRYCDEVAVDADPILRKLANVQHLFTAIEARMKPDVRLLELLQALHPSPAVGGLPRNAALAYIREHEKLDRGWYAGPVGWLDDRGDGLFAVALRSALLRNREAVIFAGCGIVAASRAGEEYAESAIKMNAMLRLLADVAGNSGAVGPERRA